MESYGNRENTIEPYGSLWKMQECSIGKLCKQGKKWSGVKYKRRRKGLGKRRQSMTL